jgi:outer membrane protein TolC
VRQNRQGGGRRRAGWRLAGLGLLGLAGGAAGCGLLHDTEPDPAVVRAGGETVQVAPAPAGGDKARDEGAYRVQTQVAGPAGGLDTPAIPPTDVQPIDLPTALERAGVANPVIGLAEQAVLGGLARQLQAQALLLPSLTVGADYDDHNGALQSSFGAIRKVNRQSAYVGLGTRVFAAETVTIPGVRLFAHLGDAWFEPQVARRVVAERQFEAVATRNDVLLDVALRYLNLLGAEGRLAVVRQSQADFAEVARLTAEYARTGQGRQGDAERAQADALLLEDEERRAQEEVAVAAADLSRFLNLDPSVRLQIVKDPIQVVELVDPHTPLLELLQVAVRNRPEVAAAGAAIAASAARVRQEQTRPLFPLLSVGYSTGGFGGGSQSTSPEFGNFKGRTDFDAYAVWTLQNFGLGNLALVRRRQAETGEAEAEQVRAINRVEREVADAYNLSAARLREVNVTRRAVQTAADGFRRDLTRIRGGQGLPIEVLNSARLLAGARQEFLRAIIAFDEAQFQLFVALGQPPTLAPGVGADGCAAAP